MPKPNQQLIATKLKLSRATVSRCFTNHPGINPQTRAKVFALASKLGYSPLEKAKPRAHAERLKLLDVAVLICVDLPNFDNTAYGNPGEEILTGVTEFARTKKISLDLHYVKPEDLSLDSPSYRRITPMRRRRWKGVLFIYPFPQTVMDELMAKYPCVSLVEQYGTTGLDCVDVDHFRGVNKLMDRLLAHGHQRIGFFTHHYDVEASWALRRHSAYMEKLFSLGMPYNPDDALNIGQHNKLDYDATHQRALELTRKGVTAWLCASDYEAYQLVEFFKKNGLSVPRDVSVTGFDGIRKPAGAPLLSTVQVPYREIGVTGVKRLSDLINRRFDSTQHILLDCALREGETIAAPRNSAL
ncbi:LacI family DNA-binding transcriptional regulator [Rariglobus hedericola]|uniref:LacI family transcriptional regulator n=1 Tax=Rariglobus hedericola TaxID=2597822 RepID=A0A556QS34_9BACT|nr:LacI family DNA-binding transcriptional regulator [Rariglobus hedericola]TSJ79455.1 LacI family transcriptional regulator [Rariglobus hedericola]